MARIPSFLQDFSLLPGPGRPCHSRARLSYAVLFFVLFFLSLAPLVVICLLVSRDSAARVLPSRTIRFESVEYLRRVLDPFSRGHSAQLESEASPMPNSKEIIDAVNSDSELFWRAGFQDRWRGVSDETFQKMAGTMLDDGWDWDWRGWTNSLRRYIYRNGSIPENFDARSHWPGYIHGMKDQQSCGSCWALHAADVLADRLAIQTQGRLKVGLSAQIMVSCDEKNLGCRGGMLSRAWQWLRETGVVHESCFPYSSWLDYRPPCRDRCVPWNIGVSFRAFKARDFYRVGNTLLDSVLHTRVRSIQEEILTNGPVEAGFYVYEDFQHYTSGVYAHRYGARKGGHAVKIIGWGTAKGVDYWVVQNSWGPLWGEGGYFRIRRGHDECKIESHVFAGMPEDYSEEQIKEIREEQGQITTDPLYMVSPLIGWGSSSGLVGKVRTEFGEFKATGTHLEEHETLRTVLDPLSPLSDITFEQF